MGELHERHSWRKERTKESVFHKINKEHGFDYRVTTLWFKILVVLTIIIVFSLPFAYDIGTKALLPNRVDPNTYIWSNTLPSNNLNAFSTQRVTFTNTSPCTSTSPCISLNPDSNGPAIAISKATVGDLSLASNKNLFIQLTYIVSQTANLNQSAVFGIYLTTNSSIPSQNPNYDPWVDSNVNMMNRIVYQGSNNYRSDILLKRGLGNSTLQSENNNVNSNDGSGSDFFVQTVNLAPATLDSIAWWLNYTGPAQPSTCQSTGIGPGCSAYAWGPFNGLSSFKGVTFQPWFQLSKQYYIGFYAQKQLNIPSIMFGFDQANIPSLYPYISVNDPTPFSGSSVFQQKTYDSGGFVGTTLRGFGIIGNNIINGGTTVYNAVVAPAFNLAGSLEGPFIAALNTAFQLLALAIRTVLNTIGGWFGIGNVGDRVIDFFTGIANFFVSVIGGGFSILDELASEGNKIITAIINFFSNGLSIFNFINDFLNSMSGLWSIIVGGWNEFLHWYTIGSMSISYFLVLWYFFGIYQVYLDGIHGLKSWLDMSEMFLLSIFRAGYWFGKESFGIVLTIKQLVAGWV